MAYEIDYNDKRFTEVEADKKEALSKVEQMYGGMIGNADKYYQAQIDNSQKWADKQTELQNKQTDFAIDKIEQEKAQAKKDYTKEQSGAYVDWQKQSNQYGAKAEQMAAGGFTGSGYGESAQVSMYNTYQNRVATAREAFTRIVADFTNAMTEARLKNSVALAEIAYKAQQQQLELSLQGFQYKNQLLLEKANKITETENIYHARYQDVLKQINTENALAEEVRQYNESLALQKQAQANTKAYQDAQIAIAREELALKKAAQAGSTITKPKGGGTNTKPKGGSSSKKPSSGSSKVAKSVANKYSKPNLSTYKQAAAYLNKKGVSGDGGLMTQSEWSRRKRSGSDRAEAAYSSYADYLNAYVSWRLGN